MIKILKEYFVKDQEKTDRDFADFNLYEEFEFGGRLFEVISERRDICKGIIGYSTFSDDERRWSYEGSNVEKYVNGWFEKSYQEYNA